MSGGIVQLVAIGAQDAYLSGKPEVSFYRSSYKRYTHFANSVERQLIQGSPSPGGVSTIRFEKKGDLLSYVYISARDSNGAMVPNIDWTSNVIDKVELLIGGQVIDTQDAYYSTRIEPVTGGQNLNQRLLPIASATQPGYNANTFYPLKFFFCKDWQSAIPLVALQYHDVELRITWAANLSTTATNVAPSGTYASLQYIVWTNFIYLDQGEREYFAKTPQDMLITQVQRQFIPPSSVMELAFANPVKFLAFQSNNYVNVYNTGGATAGSTTASLLQFKTQVNGVDIGDSRHLPAWTDILQYYHTPNGYLPTTFTANVALVSFCLDTSKLQPTGSVNFSRIDTYRIITPPNITMSNIVRNAETTIGGAVVTSLYVYAVSYNILRIQNGMGAVLYSS